jgi:hypothetical protein
MVDLSPASFFLTRCAVVLFTLGRRGGSGLRCGLRGFDGLVLRGLAVCGGVFVHSVGDTCETSLEQDFPCL